MADHPAPPPSLDPPLVFLQQAADYFAGQGVRFLSAFDVAELWSLRKQLAKRRRDCADQLRTAGACEFTDLQAGADPVTMRIDRYCLSFKRAGAEPGQVILGVPPVLAKYLAALPLPEKPLSCAPAPDPSPSDFFSQLSNGAGALSLALCPAGPTYLRPPKPQAQLV